jgi:hypothetical protein
MWQIMQNFEEKRGKSGIFNGKYALYKNIKRDTYILNPIV